MPDQHSIHFMLSDEKEVIVPCWLDSHHTPCIPSKLLSDSVWAFDLDDGKILKNHTSHAFIPAIAALEVERTWLFQNKYIRARVDWNREPGSLTFKEVK